MPQRILLLLFGLCCTAAATAQTPALDVESSTADTLLRLYDDAGFALFGDFGTGTIPAAGAGVRLMWHPAKAAFRAGRAAGTEWDEANVGDYSTAIGGGTASGTSSSAMGGGTASGNFSTAMGSGTASGDFSIAVGRLTTAQAYASLVLGQFNVVGGTTDSWDARDPVFVVGNGTSSSNRANALTLLKSGDLTLAGQIRSESGGFRFPDGTVQTTAAGAGTLPTNGAGAFDFGNEDGLVSEGTFGTGAIPVEGSGVRLMWYPAKAAFRAGSVTSTEWDDANVGNYSVAMGRSTTASGQYATAMGFAAEASDFASTALGRSTTASGVTSTAMGFNTTASGVTSTAMGSSTAATGNRSTAMGSLTTASGDRSIAMGEGTTAQAYASLVIGRYNTISGSTTTWVSTDPLFVAGNGTSTTPSNALTLLKDGNLTIAGSLTENSDQRLKTGIRPLTGALDAIAALQAVRYRFRPDANRPEGDHIGLLAQQVQAVLPELVSEGADGVLSVSYSKLTAVLVRGMQEQRATIAAQADQIEALQAEVAALREGTAARLAALEAALTASPATPPAEAATQAHE